MTTSPLEQSQPLYYAAGRQNFLLALVFMLFTSLILVAHTILGAYVGLPGFLWIVVVTLVALFTKAELAFTLVMMCLFMQNTFIAIASPFISSFDQFNQLQATNFLNIVLSSLVCVPIWFKLRRIMPADSRALMRLSVLLTAVIVFYSILGMTHASFSSVLSYTRIYMVGILLLAIGIAFGFQMKIDFAVSVVRLLTVVFVLWGVAEFFFPHALYDVFNVKDFLRLKYGAPGNVALFENIRDVIEYSSRAYLNLSGMLGLNLELLRPNGPNLHPISFAYYLTFCMLICFIYRSHFLAICCFLLALLIGAKGPLILMIVAILLYLIYASTRSLHTLLLCLFIALVGYLVIGIGYGEYTDDYHVIGFMGGVKGFFKNPIGHGIGLGGSISTMGQSALEADYEQYQKVGADYAFDSALGVMLYQIGIGSLVFLLYCRRLWISLWDAIKAHLRDEPRMVIVPITLGLLFVNGVFQEEALSPAGWGPWMLFSGFLLARHWRENQIESDLDPLNSQAAVPQYQGVNSPAAIWDKARNFVAKKSKPRKR